MRSSTKAQFAENVHEFIGKAKEKARKVSHNPHREFEATTEKNSGTLQKKSGGVAKGLGK